MSIGRGALPAISAAGFAGMTKKITNVTTVTAMKRTTAHRMRRMTYRITERRSAKRRSAASRRRSPARCFLLEAHGPEVGPSVDRLIHVAARIHARREVRRKRRVVQVRVRRVVLRNRHVQVAVRRVARVAAERSSPLELLVDRGDVEVREVL